MTQKEELRKHPDFPEWIKSEEGLKCLDMSTLDDQKYLKNRLFWAFDAGRNCVWNQYMESKQKISHLEATLEVADEIMDLLKLRDAQNGTLLPFRQEQLRVAREKYHQLKTKSQS